MKMKELAGVWTLMRKKFKLTKSDWKNKIEVTMEIVV
jgi:hypothetical protein